MRLICRLRLSSHFSAHWQRLSSDYIGGSFGTRCFQKIYGVQRLVKGFRGLGPFTQIHDEFDHSGTKYMLIISSCKLTRRASPLPVYHDVRSNIPNSFQNRSMAGDFTGRATTQFIPTWAFKTYKPLPYVIGVLGMPCSAPRTNAVSTHIMRMTSSTTIHHWVYPITVQYWKILYNGVYAAPSGPILTQVSRQWLMGFRSETFSLSTISLFYRLRKCELFY